MHDKLVKHGAELGFAYGGRVKDTSGEFSAKKGKMKSMDSGVQPARRGKNARNQAQARQWLEVRRRQRCGQECIEVLRLKDVLACPVARLAF